MRKSNNPTRINPADISVYRQDWHDFTRFIFCNGGGSVQIELFKEPIERVNCKALLYALWVDEPVRRQGCASALMDIAEKTAKEMGYSEIALEWSLFDSPYQIFNWYERRGYNETLFDGRGEYSVMVKQL